MYACIDRIKRLFKNSDPPNSYVKVENFSTSIVSKVRDNRLKHVSGNLDKCVWLCLDSSDNFIIQKTQINEWRVNKEYRIGKYIGPKNFIKYIDGLKLVLQYYPAGDGIDLVKYLHDKYMVEEKIQLIVMRLSISLAKQIKLLHDIDMAHMDIKPDNILYDHNADILVLTDFEFACYTKAKDYHVVGTLNYVDPYLYMYNDKSVTEEPDLKKCDIYSMGITLWSLIYKQYPFIDPKVPYTNIPSYSKGFDTLNKLLFDMIKIDNRSRPTIDEFIVKCEAALSGVSIPKMCVLDYLDLAQP